MHLGPVPGTAVCLNLYGYNLECTKYREEGLLTDLSLFLSSVSDLKLLCVSVVYTHHAPGIERECCHMQRAASELLTSSPHTKKHSQIHEVCAYRHQSTKQAE